MLKELNKFKKQLLDKNVNIDFTEECISYIAEKGTSERIWCKRNKRIINQI